MVLAAALVCLAVLMLVAAGLVQTTLLRHRQARVEQHRLQAMWLAESAVDRALARLDRDAAYTGETWQVSLDDARGPRPGVAQISIEPVDGDPERRIHVLARWPADKPVRAVVYETGFTVLPPDARDDS